MLLLAIIAESCAGQSLFSGLPSIWRGSSFVRQFQDLAALMQNNIPTPGGYFATGT
jgi:hypothetical protein